MIIETLYFIVITALCSLIGLGPALALLSDYPRRVPHAFAISPTVGFGILVLIGFPLVRFVSPVAIWALPVTMLLLILSGGLVVWDYRRNAMAYRWLLDWRGRLVNVVFSFGILALLSGPALVNGIQYAIFRSNSSDAFFYTSLARSVKTVPWSIFMAGAPLTRANMAAVTVLGHMLPSSLFSARFVLSPASLGKVITLGWMSELLRIPVYRFYYFGNLLGPACAALVALAMGEHLQLSRPLKYLTAAFIALGFWIHFVVELDASYEISILPLGMLVVFAWMRYEQKGGVALISRERIFLSLAWASILAFYVPVAACMVLGFAFYYGIGLLQRQVSLRAVLSHAITIGMIVFVLSITLQIDYLLRYYFYVFSIVDVERKIPPLVLKIITFNGPAAIWGIPRSPYFDLFPKLISLVARRAADVVGIGVLGMFFASLWVALRRPTLTAQRIVISLFIGGMALGTYYLLTGATNAMGKAFTYSYPYLVFSALIVVAYPLWQAPLVTRVTKSLAQVWLVIGIVIGLAFLYSTQWQAIPIRPRQEQYDLGAIENYLRENPPRLLLVNIPRSKGWEFAYYSMLVFQEYPSYFQSGLVIDNNTTIQPLWLDEFTQLPDYAVVSKAVDYIGPQKLGTSVAETPDLILYKITVNDLAVFQQAEQESKQREATKPMFETLAAP